MILNILILKLFYIIATSRLERTSFPDRQTSKMQNRTSICSSHITILESLTVMVISFHLNRVTKVHGRRHSPKETGKKRGISDLDIITGGVAGSQ